jgi:glycosyltransferase involved in cell wall biosynthesis
VAEPVTVSIVIPAYNAAQTIAVTLEALAEQAAHDDFEVIVADNGSTDQTRQLAEQWCNRLPLRVIDASARQGQAAAMNIAARHVRGELIVFTDADDVPLPGWLDAWRNLDASAGHASGPVAWFGYGESPMDASIRVPSRLPVHMGFLAYALGTNFAVRRSCLERAHGFDEGVPPAQDVDLSWRLQLGGTELVFVRDAVLAKRERRGVCNVVKQYYKYGLCDPILYRRFRGLGVPEPRFTAVLKSYFGLVARLPLLFDRKQRIRWARQIGRRLGRLIGSIRTRTFYP